MNFKVKILGLCSKIINQYLFNQKNTKDIYTMTDINQYVTDYLDYYCGLEDSPGFAVLLKGEWGSGKTWFIKKYREKLEAEIKKDEYQIIYITLYGVKNIDDIAYIFLEQSIPTLASSKWSKLGFNFIKLILNSQKIDLEKLKIDFSKYIVNNKKILIFDDLERCQIDISNIMGYMNYFVEQQGSKVIIIANEDIIFDNYKDTKEKLIGKTFNIAPDIDSALNGFIKNIEDSDIQKFLIKNAEFIKTLYGQAKCTNLRILKQIILDFERIYEKLDKEKNKQEVLQEIIKVLTIFSIEIKMANLQPKDINKLLDAQVEIQARRNTNRRNGSFSEENSDVQEDKNNLQEICDKYSYLQIYDPFPSAIWWEDFFDKGIVNSKELNKEIANKYYLDDNTPNWLRLFYLNGLNDDEFDKYREIVESEFNNREYKDISIIKHIVGCFLYFSNNGLYVKAKEEILKDAKIYIDDLITNLNSNNQLEVLELINENNQDSSVNPISNSDFRLGFYSQEIQEFKDFYNYIDEVLNKKLSNPQYMGNLAQELLEIMKNDVKEFYSMICIQSLTNKKIRRKYDEIPILKYIPQQNFVETLLSMKYDNKKYVFWALKERYKQIDVHFYPKLIEEIEWLKMVQDLLLKEVDKRQGKLSGYQLKELIDRNLSKAISTLEDIQIQQINKSVN
ncbi:P-loop NTPase fold protein [Anabaena cylindrica UHCC 0172]|uniref:P-loop NTPase fold protein n=1 Tax=Anabaena cylindrica TaxID=1165 RepID=UPI002B219217|nr:P-loop NTPase fold protein [Anabaena cylindrica]MEA5552144.1 P-loop NTPase fold protein [Anabaena cylindrica UHCC 0172]